MPRPLNKIAADILADWGPPGKSQPSYRVYCKPYVAAMLCMGHINDTFGLDPADDIVRYFLSNAGPWRGEKAKAIKAELNQLLKVANVSNQR
jgi:hypothetical protein